MYNIQHILILVSVEPKFFCKTNNYDPSTFYAELENNLTVSIPIYSVPNDIEPGQLTWENGTGSAITASSKIKFDIEKMVIQCDFYGKSITRSGQAATLTIHKFEIYHAGNFTLEVTRSNNTYALPFLILIAGREFQNVTCSSYF